MFTLLPIGSIFAGRYRVGRCIASGGMGAVHEVEHVETGRLAALKVMLPHVLSGEGAREQFKTEARVVLSPVAAALPETTQLDDLYQPLPPEAMGPPSAPLAELPLLVTLGFYLMVLEIMDTAAAAAATT